MMEEIQDKLLTINKLKSAMPFIVDKQATPNHQTAVVINFDPETISSKEERITRFLSGLGLSSTIKVDIYTVADNLVYRGYYIGGAHASEPPEWFLDLLKNYTLVINV